MLLPYEEKIVAQIKASALSRNSILRFNIWKSLIEFLEKIDVGKLAPEFYTDPDVIAFCETALNVNYIGVRIRIAIEKYIGSDRSTLERDKLKLLFESLREPQGGLQRKTAGTYLMPLSKELACQIHLVLERDEEFIKLFKQYYPTPSIEIFRAVNRGIPKIIQEEADAIKHTLTTAKKNFIKKNKASILELQRALRMKKRKEEEKKRFLIIELGVEHIDNEQAFHLAEAALNDANTPYTPLCESELSRRLMEAAAEKPPAFSTVKHITTKEVLKNILDDALYGRKTLQDFYLDYSPAAMKECDVLNGDANVVCLGPQRIDPTAKGEIILEFDVMQLILKNPVAFYKQYDLGYIPGGTYEINLGDETIEFTHGYQNRKSSSQVRVGIRFEKGKEIVSSLLSKNLLISYNLEQMHQILTLNFFRFIDEIAKTMPEYAQRFYEKVGKLGKPELYQFLTDLEKSMTHTAEFNFYGAHQIDFSTVTKISVKDKAKNTENTIILSQFIDALKNGDLDELRHARAKIPELFTSYRFLDYLLQQIPQNPCSEEVCYYLDALRAPCQTPAWVEYQPRNFAQSFHIDWQEKPVNAPKTAHQPPGNYQPAHFKRNTLNGGGGEGDEKEKEEENTFAKKT